MPYQTIADLPASVTNEYDNPKQQRAFLAAFNAAITKTPDDESSAFAIAHSAAQGVKSIEVDFFSESGFKALPDNRFIAWYTNPYQDKDKEWFAEKAIERDISLMQESGQFPELWFYHVDGTKFGQCDTVFKAGRFAVALGQFDDTPQAQSFKSFAIENNFKLSHGFTYDPVYFVDNTYHKFHTFEISVLPPEVAANPYTFFAKSDDLGEKQMDISPQQQAVINQALKGTGLTLESILTSSQKASHKLDEKVSYKAAPEEIVAQDMGEGAEMPEIEVEAPLPTDMSQLKDVLKAIMSKLDTLDSMKVLMEKEFGTQPAPTPIAPTTKADATEAGEDKEMAKAIKAINARLDNIEASLSNRQQAFNIADAMQDVYRNQQKQIQPGQPDINWFVQQAFGEGQ